MTHASLRRPRGVPHSVNAEISAGRRRTTHGRRRPQIELASGSAVAIPVSQVEGLAGTKAVQIQAVKVMGGGYGFHWPALDLDLAVLELIAGCFGTRAWMSALGRKAGQATSEVKAAAPRENGRKGGRPWKVDSPAPGEVQR